MKTKIYVLEKCLFLSSSIAKMDVHNQTVSLLCSMRNFNMFLSMLRTLLQSITTIRMFYIAYILTDMILLFIYLSKRLNVLKKLFYMPIIDI